MYLSGSLNYQLLCHFPPCLWGWEGTKQLWLTHNSGYLFEYMERRLPSGSTNLLNCNSVVLNSTIKVALKLTKKQMQIMSHS